MWEESRVEIPAEIRNRTIAGGTEDIFRGFRMTSDRNKAAVIVQIR